MSASSPTDIEAQIPTPGVEAERSTHPSQEQAMSSDSTTQGSTGAPNVSAQSETTPEDTVSTPSSTVPSSGAQAEPASTPSGSAPAQAGDAPATPAPGKKRGKDKKPRKQGRAYDASGTFEKAAKVLERAAGSSDDQVQAEAAAVRHFNTELNQSSTDLRTALAREDAAKGLRDEAEARLAPAMGTVFWPIRLQAGGVQFLKDREAPTYVKTVTLVLEALSGSAFHVPAESVDALRRLLGPAQAASDASDKREEEAALAKKRFRADRRNLEAAIKALNRSIEHEKFASVVPPVPAKGAKKKGA